ncbi:hypothetical protein ABZS63_37360, partial [Streptomyces sp. NPDC005568]
QAVRGHRASAPRYASSAARSRGVKSSMGPSAHIVGVADPAAGRQALDRREVVASLSQGAGNADDTLHLEVAGANGQSTTAIATGLVRMYAQETGQRLTVADVISPVLPPGAAVRAVGSLRYFRGTPMITLAIWAVGAALLVAAKPKSS